MFATDPIRKPATRAGSIAQTIGSITTSRRYRRNPAFRRTVMERVEYFAHRAGDREISELVRESLRRQWPGMTEADVDWVVTHSYLAERVENATRREAALNGEQMAREAGAAVWGEAVEACA
jgi:hypothetical protein